MRHPIGEAVCLCERVMMADDEARRGIELDSTSEMGRMAGRASSCLQSCRPVSCHLGRWGWARWNSIGLASGFIWLSSELGVDRVASFLQLLRSCLQEFWVIPDP